MRKAIQALCIFLATVIWMAGIVLLAETEVPHPYQYSLWSNEKAIEKACAFSGLQVKAYDIRATNNGLDITLKCSASAHRPTLNEERNEALDQVIDFLKYMKPNRSLHFIRFVVFDYSERELLCRIEFSYDSVRNTIFEELHINELINIADFYEAF